MYRTMNHSLSLYDHRGVWQQLIYWIGTLVLGFLLHGVVQAACTAANMLEDTPTAAFIDNSDGTVTHSPTGLTWDRCSWGQTWDGAACTGSASTHDWAAAQAVAISANSSSHLGQSDWRLPNQRELLSIVETCGYNPVINRAIFPNTPSSGFWSASSYASYPVVAWGVYFDYGYDYADFKSNDDRVRLVRGGQSLDAFDLLAKTITTTILDVSPVSPSTYSDVVTLTATVTGDSPSGTVQFKSGDAGLTCDDGDQTLAVGIATCVVNAFDVASYSLSASYPGDGDNWSSDSSDVGHDVGKKALTVTDLSAANKVYDGTTDATINGTGSLVGVIAGDTVILAGSASGIFASPNVGSAIAVAISGLSLTDADAGNYSLTDPTSSADITAKGLTVTGLSAANKVYDGTTDAIIDGTGSLVGVIAGDTVTLAGSASGVFASPNVDADIVVTISGLSLSETDAGNYSLALPIETTADITPAEQVIIGFAVGTDIGLVGETTSLMAQGGQSTSPLVFSSSTESICQVDVAGLAFLDPGQCDVQANQAGDANYYAAAEQNQSLRVVVSGCGDVDEDGIPDDIDATPRDTNPNECKDSEGILYGTVVKDSQVLCADTSLAQADASVLVEADALASFIGPASMLNAGFTAKARSIVIINNKSSCSP